MQNTRDRAVIMTRSTISTPRELLQEQVRQHIQDILDPRYVAPARAVQALLPVVVGKAVH